MERAERDCPPPRRRAGRDRVAISALMAVGRVHQYLVQLQKRSRVGLLLETGEAREVRRAARAAGHAGRAELQACSAGCAAVRWLRLCRAPLRLRCLPRQEAPAA